MLQGHVGRAPRMEVQLCLQGGIAPPENPLMAARRELLEETGMHSVTFLAQVSPATSLPCSHGASAGSDASGRLTAEAVQAWLPCSGRLLSLPTSLPGPAEPSKARTVCPAQRRLLVHC